MMGHLPSPYLLLTSPNSSRNAPLLEENYPFVWQPGSTTPAFKAVGAQYKNHPASAHFGRNIAPDLSPVSDALELVMESPVGDSTDDIAQA
ncbi:hypothetical protein V5799_028159 [Amblyomma americanum]|uniref:Uncharacterized protein n=1 Tax=Amblyomma americanum TaxID=6943 RepID=A0AAQ4DDN4_AMBAM